MGWHVGLMYCSMEGNCSLLRINIVCFFIHHFFVIVCIRQFVTQLSQIRSTARRWLTTAPGSPTTHWYQLRCVLSQPIYVVAGQEITGRMHLIAHTAQSYTIYLTLSGW